MEVIREAATLIIVRNGPEGLEALVGQNEVVNHLKSTFENTVFMCFPGEYKFPGGMVEGEETKEAAAVREAEEEFPGIRLPSQQTLHLFNAVLVTGKKPCIMNNYVLSIGENTELQVDTSFINAQLETRRQRYKAAIESGAYYSLDMAEKAELSPEVRQVSWLPVQRIIEIGKQEGYVNEWQQKEFERYRKPVAERERTIRTLEVLTELQKYQTIAALTVYLQAR